MTILNDAYYNNLMSAINATKDCATLEKILNQMEAEITTEINLILSQIAVLKLVISIPYTPQALLNWVQNFIGLITRPYTLQIAQLEALVSKYAALLNAISNININLSCGLTMPSIPALPSLTAAGSSTAISGVLIKGGLNNE